MIIEDAEGEPLLVILPLHQARSILVHLPFSIVKQESVEAVVGDFVLAALTRHLYSPTLSQPISTDHHTSEISSMPTLAGPLACLRISILTVE